jgi:YjbE family integral membrane protein
VPKEDQGNSHGKPVDSFWEAMKTIIVADALMGLDNVLAVAGAAKGSYLLVILGLLMSIPIVVWGSTLILKWVDRFPVIVYIGAGVLAWTAAQMMLQEPILAPLVDGHFLIPVIAYAGIIGGVLLAGLVASRRRKQAA